MKTNTEITAAKSFLFPRAEKFGSLQITAAIFAFTILIFLSAAPVRAQQFCNPAPIAIPTSGAANPYPSDLTVSGATGSIADVSVTLNNFQHNNAPNVDILLVSPGGRKFIVFSDTGGASGLDTAATITFSDAATSSIPSSGVIAPGTYKPVNFSTGDTFPAPAPGEPYQSPPSAGSATFRSVFEQSEPNGVWSLYVVDDTSNADGGSIGGGWCLNITTVAPNPGQLQFSRATYTGVREGFNKATITVRRTGGSLGAVSVNYETVGGGTATGGANCEQGVDFINASGSVSFADGETGDKTFIVQLCRDVESEPDETINLQLSAPTGGASLGSPSAAVLTVQNSGVGTISFGSPPAYAASDYQQQTVQVLVSNVNTDNTQDEVDLNVSGGTATAGAACAEGVDFIAPPTRMQVIGNTGTFVSITVCADALDEQNEYFSLTLSNPSAGAVINSSQATANVTIVENQPSIYTVNTDTEATDGLCDAAHCSLREAIILANAAPSADEIRFDAAFFSTARTILVTNRRFEITRDLSLTGAGADRLTILADNTTNRHFRTTANVSLSGMTLAGTGAVNSDRGGITNTGTLSLTRVALRGNVADGGGGANRGVIENNGGSVTIIDSEVSGNFGVFTTGGIYNNGGTTNITNSTISGNTLNFSGGAGIFNAGGTVNLSHATVFGNSLVSASLDGGGIYNAAGGTINIRGTIVAGNLKDGAKSDAAGAFASQGYNLIGTADGATGFVNGANGDKAGTNAAAIDAGLLPLAYNGGTTRTNALQSTSPAMDAANPADFPGADQRGVTRPIDGDGNGSPLPDIGAFEYAAATTAAGVSVSGRVFARRRGLARAVVYITDQAGNTRTARTDRLGFYRFDEIETGQTYIFNVYSRQYQFDVKVLTISGNLDELDFTARR